MEELTPTEAQELKQEDYILIDVRSKEEWDMIHDDSLHISIHEEEFRDRILQLDKSKKYAVFCKSGERSFHAAKLMEEHGFNVVNINGWMFA